MPIKWDKAALNPQSFNETIFTSIGGLFGAVELSEKNTQKKNAFGGFFSGTYCSGNPFILG